MSVLSILALGDTNRTEFRVARSCLDRWGTVKDVATADAAAIELTEGGFAPDVIVVAQAFPGQFSQNDVNRLRRLAPLARVLGLMGSWCEGEMRTGTPWPAAVRTYWHQWETRCDRELRRLTGGKCTSWALPVTAVEEERLLVNAVAEWPIRHGLIVIDTLSREMHDWLSAACRSRGFSTVWQRRSRSARPEGAAAGLFGRACLSGANGDEEAALRRLVAQIHPSPVFAMFDFPRVEDRRLALAAGATAILSKPLAVDDLFWELDAIPA